ncbi:MAG: ATP-binding cassette domain-containing protein [Spirochaetaceae bacterium]|jgi:ABC-type lipoprotein export system ATPase subunit|nr:ATP-binding cassette domain-containing protein [Spirochaetaceae bacterium]
MRRLTIQGGRGKEGDPEHLEITLCRGDTLCIVGPTGAGKSRFLEDISSLAQGDSPTGRRILIDGAVPDDKTRHSLEGRIIAQLSQNMNFIMDLSVREFILMHGESRKQRRGVRDDLADRIVAAANSLTGEALSADQGVTELSGGQSRALMIADTALLSPSPVVLIDELENAGVDRRRALDLLAGEDKIVLVSTHDPVLALLGERRLCIRGGAVRRVIETSPAEQRNLAFLSAVNERFLALRDMLREGAVLDFDIKKYFDGAFSDFGDGID